MKSGCGRMIKEGTSMIEIKAIGGGYDCKIVGNASPREVMIEGAACVGAIIGAIAYEDGIAEARAFAKALKELLEDKEAVNAAIQAGIDAGKKVMQ